MAKRGQRASHRLRYRWSNGIHDSIPCSSRDDLTMRWDIMRQRADARDLALELAVDERQDDGSWLEVVDFREVSPATAGQDAQ